MHGKLLSISAITTILSLQPVPLAAGELENNPFARPPLQKPSGNPGDDSSAAASADVLELRGTLSAGSGSLANINGVILQVGEEWGGYRLVAVGDRIATLERDGLQQTLSIAEQDSGRRND